MKLPIVFEVEMELESVTAEDVERCVRHFGPVVDGERVLGVVSDPVLQELWALGFRYQGKASKLQVRAAFEADGAIEEAELAEESGRLEALSDLCRSIFWVEAKSHIGGGAWRKDSIGIRDGFTLVQGPAGGGSIPASIARFIGLPPGE